MPEPQLATDIGSGAGIEVYEYVQEYVGTAFSSDFFPYSYTYSYTQIPSASVVCVNLPKFTTDTNSSWFEFPRCSMAEILASRNAASTA